MKDVVRYIVIKYCEKSSAFQELLCKDSCVSFHMKNIKTIATEKNRVANISPKIIKDFNFRGEIGYDLRQYFRRPLVNSVYNGTDSVSFLGPKIWEIIPKKIKKLESLNHFSAKKNKKKLETK